LAHPQTSSEGHLSTAAGPISTKKFGHLWGEKQRAKPQAGSDLGGGEKKTGLKK
jgi:hypothetical protein